MLLTGSNIEPKYLTQWTQRYWFLGTPFLMLQKQTIQRQCRTATVLKLFNRTKQSRDLHVAYRILYRILLEPSHSRNT